VRRRQFIAGAWQRGGVAVCGAGAAAVVPVIGFLSSQSADDDFKNVTVPFLQGLKETGYVEGQNVAVEYRWAENQYDRLPALAADLVRRRIAVIVAAGTPATLAAKVAKQPAMPVIGFVQSRTADASVGYATAFLAGGPIRWPAGADG
jgi:putative ABC transport system substrate-binding protein